MNNLLLYPNTSINFLIKFLLGLKYIAMLTEKIVNPRNILSRDTNKLYLQT